MKRPAGDLELLFCGIDGLQRLEPRHDLGDQLPNIHAFMHLRPIDGRTVAQDAPAQVGDDAHFGAWAFVAERPAVAEPDVIEHRFLRCGPTFVARADRQDHGLLGPAAKMPGVQRCAQIRNKIEFAEGPLGEGGIGIRAEQVAAETQSRAHPAGVGSLHAAHRVETWLCR